MTVKNDEISSNETIQESQYNEIVRDTQEVACGLEKAIQSRDDKIDSMHIEFSSVMSELHEMQKKLKKSQSQCTSLTNEVGTMKSNHQKSERFRVENLRLKSKLETVSKLLQGFHKRQEPLVRLAIEKRDRVRSSCAEREKTILEMAKLERRLKPAFIIEQQQSKRLMEQQRGVLEEMINTMSS